MNKHVHAARIGSDWIECMIWDPESMDLFVFIVGSNGAEVFEGIRERDAHQVMKMCKDGDEDEALRTTGEIATNHRLDDRDEAYAKLIRSTLFAKTNTKSWPPLSAFVKELGNGIGLYPPGCVDRFDRHTGKQIG